jgi:hypothetical protein
MERWSKVDNILFKAISEIRGKLSSNSQPLLRASSGPLERFPVKWIRFTGENALGNKEPFPAKWIRSAVEKASDNTTRADSM